MNKITCRLAALTLLSIAATAHAFPATGPNSYKGLQKDPFYIGGLFGYGNTNWSELVATDDLTRLSTPSSAGGSGAVWGFMAGYNITPYFAVEADYTHFPDSDVTFAPTPPPLKPLYPVSQMTSKTDNIALIGKFITPIFNTGFRAFADVGAAVTHRSDDLANLWQVVPAFGTGVDYNVTEHLMTELSFQYYAGYGEATATPADVYIPFLYSINLRVGYRFNFF